MIQRNLILERGNNSGNNNGDVSRVSTKIDLKSRCNFPTEAWKERKKLFFSKIEKSEFY